MLFFNLFENNNDCVPSTLLSVHIQFKYETYWVGGPRLLFFNLILFISLSYCEDKWSWEFQTFLLDARTFI